MLADLVQKFASEERVMRSIVHHIQEDHDGSNTYTNIREKEPSQL